MKIFSSLSIDWSPFTVCGDGEKAPYPRALSTVEGLGDRLRFVAFAEKQATHAFLAAAEYFPDLSQNARNVWKILAKEEQKHLQWLLWRMEELKVDVAERPQSLAIWHSFDHCTSAQQFATFMANAEERGRIAGEKFYETLLKIDPVTANVFHQIAKEEQEHIRLAKSLSDFGFQIPDEFDVSVAGVPLEGYSGLCGGVSKTP